MSEKSKTITFVVAAALLVVIAVFSRPRLSQPEQDQPQGADLFEEFEPLEAASLEIVQYDEEESTVRPFKVAQAPSRSGKSRWSIPSHDNYPADAEDQLADAASSLMGLKIIDRVSDSAGEHATYGVVEPDTKKLRPGATGVGTKVVLRDDDGEELVAMIIGKQVPDRKSLRYVRRVGEDPVYIVEVSTDKLSTRFKDWIEEDLLDLSPWDVSEITVLDYSYDELRAQPMVRGQFTVEHHDTGDPRWTLVDHQVFEEGRFLDRPLGEDQQLNADKLDEMRNALDELEIVDVAPKPEGLSADLRDTGSFVPDPQARDSLASRGFYLVPVSQTQSQLLSNEGEVNVLMKDGVQYVLRFGNLAAGTGGGAREGEEAEDTELNRYLFVMAEFNPEAIPKPELEPIPGTNATDTEATDTEATDASDSDEDVADGADDADGEPAEQPTSSDTGSESDSAEEESADAEDNSAANNSADDGRAADDSAADDSAADDRANDDSAVDAGQPAATDDGEPASDGEATDAEPVEPPAPTPEEIEAIKRENRRKQEEYQEKVERAKEKVEELNDRFADWYYVISDEVYQKIHLSFDEIVEPKEQPEGEGAEDAAGAADATGLQRFDALKSGGPAVE